MKEELKKAAIGSLKSFETMSIEDLPVVIETIQSCYRTSSPDDEYLRQELQFFIDGLRK